MNLNSTSASCAEIPWNTASPGWKSCKTGPTTCTGHVRGHSLHQHLRVNVLPAGLFLRLRQIHTNTLHHTNATRTFEASTPIPDQPRSSESPTVDRPLLNLLQPPWAMPQTAVSTGRCSKPNTGLRNASPLHCPDTPIHHTTTTANIT